MMLISLLLALTLSSYATDDYATLPLAARRVVYYSPFSRTSVLGVAPFYKQTKVHGIRSCMTTTTEGALLSAMYDHTHTQEWQWGFRMQLPIMHYKQRDFYAPRITSAEKERAQVETTEMFFGEPIKVGAWRVGFLSELPLAPTDLGMCAPMVDFYNKQYPQKPVTFGGVVINNSTVPPVTFIRSTGKPTGTLAATPSTAATATPLASDGTTGVQGERLRAVPTTEYDLLQNNKKSQSSLWLVPTVDQIASVVQYVPPAQTIFATIATTVDALSRSYTYCKKNTGLGQLETTMYLRYTRPWIFVETFIGALWKTATVQHDQSQNALLAGVQSEVALCSWWKFHVDGFVAFAPRATVTLPVPFDRYCCASSSEITPKKVTRTWTTLWSHADFAWRLTQGGELWLLFSYELFFRPRPDVFMACKLYARDSQHQERLLDFGAVAPRRGYVENALRLECWLYPEIGDIVLGVVKTVGQHKQKPESLQVFGRLGLYY